MQENYLFYLFYLVFLSQIVLISFYYPRKILGRMRYVFDTYPPSAYPKLYPKPVEYYEKTQRNYRTMNQIILLAGLILIAMGISRSGEWDHAIATWCVLVFLVQVFPLALLDIWSIKCFKLMRNANSRRKAELHPRRLLDFISPTMIGMAIFVYVAFILFVLYLRQFEFPWFGGYWNIFGITAMNLFLVGLVFWHMYGKKLNPHQTYEDRKKQIELSAKILAFVSIASTMHIAITVVLSALDLRDLQPIAMCLYFQLIAVIAFQGYRIDNTNFDVYKEDPLVA